MVLGYTVFLDAEPQVLVMKLQIRLDDPVMSVRSPALKYKRVRPESPLRNRTQMAFRAANGLIRERFATGQSHATGLGIAFEEFGVAKVADDDGLVFNRVHGIWFSCGHVAAQAAILVPSRAS